MTNRLLTHFVQRFPANRDGRPSVLLQAEFTAGLTANQPHEYLRRAGGPVLVVCPPHRMEPLWPGLLRRSEPVGAVTQRALRGATRTAAVGDTVLGLTTWAAVLDSLQRQIDRVLDLIRTRTADQEAP